MEFVPLFFNATARVGVAFPRIYIHVDNFGSAGLIYLRYRRRGRDVRHIYINVLSFRYPFGSWQSLNGRIVASVALASEPQTQPITFYFFLISYSGRRLVRVLDAMHSRTNRARSNGTNH